MDSPRLPWWDEIAWMVRTSRRDAALLPGWLSAPVRLDDSDREGAVRTLLRGYKNTPAELNDAYLNDVADATGSGRYAADAGQHLWMTWDMLREMQTRGMTIGGHTVNHPVLTRAPREIQRREIGECSRRLSEELGQPMRFFSYPVGGDQAFDAVTRQCLREVGVQYAFSYYAGYRRFSDWDDYDIRRVPVEADLSAQWFRSTLLLPQLLA